MMEDRLGARYTRIDALRPAQAGLGIDVATREASQTLKDLAERAVDAMDQDTLDAFASASG